MRSVVLVVAVLGAGACQTSKQAEPLPPPSEALVRAMRDYCKIAAMPLDKQREALKLWGWHNAGDKDIGPMWTRAVKKDRVAIATVRAAAEAAVGRGNCTQLDALGAP